MLANQNTGTTRRSPSGLDDSKVWYNRPMVYKIIGGIFLVLLGLSLCGITVIPSIVVGILGVIAGVALLAGL